MPGGKVMLRDPVATAVATSTLQDVATANLFATRVLQLMTVLHVLAVLAHVADPSNALARISFAPVTFNSEK